MYDRYLRRVARIAQIINRADVEEAATADTCQIKLQNGFRRQAEKRAQRILVLRKPVILEKVEVREQHPIPAPHPFVVQCELALGVDAATEGAVSGLTGVGSRVQLVDAIGADLIRSVDQALAELALEQDALPGREARIEGRVIIGSDCPVERGFNGKP